MLDLKNLDIKKNADKGARLFFDHPTIEGEKLDLFMDVLGRDSIKFKTLQKEKQLKLMNSKIVGKKSLTMEDIEDSESDDMELVASLVVGLGDKEKGKIVEYMLLDDKEIKFSKKNVLMLFDRFPFMKEQVNKFVWDRANFL